jgi:hypothetical protein
MLSNYNKYDIYISGGTIVDNSLLANVSGTFQPDGHRRHHIFMGYPYITDRTTYRSCSVIHEGDTIGAVGFGHYDFSIPDTWEDISSAQYPQNVTPPQPRGWYDLPLYHSDKDLYSNYHGYIVNDKQTGLLTNALVGGGAALYVEGGMISDLASLATYLMRYYEFKNDKPYEYIYIKCVGDMSSAVYTTSSDGTFRYQNIAQAHRWVEPPRQGVYRDVGLYGQLDYNTGGYSLTVQAQNINDNDRKQSNFRIMFDGSQFVEAPNTNTKQYYADGSFVQVDGNVYKFYYKNGDTWLSTNVANKESIPNSTKYDYFKVFGVKRFVIDIDECAIQFQYKADSLMSGNDTFCKAKRKTINGIDYGSNANGYNADTWYSVDLVTPLRKFLENNNINFSIYNIAAINSYL